MLAAALLGHPAGVASGQTAPALAADASATAPAAARPLGDYAARERLMMYVEFDGLDAHEDAWHRTAAYRMLNDTPLGGMLEEVASPLFERVAVWLPNRKLNGAEAVAVAKHVARKGFALAYHADPSAPSGVRGVLVLRGAVTKETKPLFGRLVGSFMGAASKPRIERKSGRPVVVVPPADADPKATDVGWAWWDEAGDLVLGLGQPSDADAALAALDGKAPSLAGFEPVEALRKAEGGLEPVLTAYIDPSIRPSGDGKPPLPLPDLGGVQRIEYRWGFQEEALASVTRIVAPKPRQGALAFLDEPAFEAKKLLPIPDGVEAFASASLKPEQWGSMLAGLLGDGPAKARYDELVEGLRSRNRTDLEKDLLGNLGPRVVFYLMPSSSSAAVEDAPPPSLAAPMALLSSMGPQMPRPVLVAEVVDAARFGRSLDAVMIEINKEIKAVAAEQLAEAVKAEAAGAGPGGPGTPPGLEGSGRGPDRKDRKRDEAAIPEFRLIPSTGGETSRTYMFNVPSASEVKLFPPGFKPTIRLEGSFLAVSTSPEAARVAMESLRRKPWSPAEEVARAMEKAPDDAVLVFFNDASEASSTALASLPGVLQTGFNTAVALSERIMNPPDPAVAQQGRGPGQPGASSAPGGMGSSSMMNSSMNRSFGSRPMNSSMAGPGMMSSGPQPGPGGPGAAAGAAGPSGSDASMIQIRVDAARLPKAEELKGLMFPSTTVLAVDDEAIRIETRGAFPDATALLNAKGFLPAVLAPAIAAARTAAKAAEAAPAADQPGQQPGQPGQPGAPGQASPGGAMGRPPGPPGAPGAPGAPAAPGGSTVRDR